jgi:hypothetical protein
MLVMCEQLTKGAQERGSRLQRLDAGGCATPDPSTCAELPTVYKNVRMLEARQCAAELGQTRASCAVEAKQDVRFPGSGASDMTRSAATFFLELCRYTRTHTGRGLHISNPKPKKNMSAMRMRRTQMVK